MISFQTSNGKSFMKAMEKFIGILQLMGHPEVSFETPFSLLKLLSICDFQSCVWKNHPLFFKMSNLLTYQ